MKDELIPVPFLFGGGGVAAVRFQFIGQYVNTLEGDSAVILGWIIIIFTSYSIYTDWALLKKNGAEMRKANLFLLGYVLCLLLIVFSPLNTPGKLMVFAGMICPVIFGYLFYKEKWRLLERAKETSAGESDQIK